MKSLNASEISKIIKSAKDSFEDYQSQGGGKVSKKMINTFIKGHKLSKEDSKKFVDLKELFLIKSIIFEGFGLVSSGFD